MIVTESGGQRVGLHDGKVMDVVPGIMGRQSPEAVLSQKLRAVVLLAGSVRQGRLGFQIGRPVFDLPLDQGQTILNYWRHETQGLASAVRHANLPVRILIDRTAPEPPPGSYGPATGAAPVEVERDPLDFRGTGGVLRDLAARFADDDLLLVANAAQVLMEGLADLTLEMVATRGDVAIISHADGTPSGLLLVRCGALRELPQTGFIDMKEQALPMIAANHQVAVLERKHPSALPVLTLADYITAVRRHHQRRAGKTHIAGPFAEDWESEFSIVEDGADVHSRARLHDSVVLRGGRVEIDAVLAHSVVCPGGVLRRGQMAVDALVTAGGNGRQRD